MPNHDLPTSPSQSKDWLNYDIYAHTLWRRIDPRYRSPAPASTLENAQVGPPTGDPLVVGIYGEWGTGKTKLLELLYDKAYASSVQTCVQRATDPDAFNKELSLTVPVWFHPWKYEHEPHLTVPLLMHIAEALNQTLEGANSFAEQAEAKIKGGTEVAKDFVEGAKEKARLLTKVAQGVHDVASSTIAKTVAAYVGGSMAEKALEFVAETAEKFSPANPDKEANEEKRTAKAKSAAQSTPTHTVDGRYYYNTHHYLAQLACIKPKAGPNKGLNQDLEINTQVRLNFVVFVDDLDRCLPEKAVEVLEIIKTVFNVDCFTFVVALDDEVIERGISHRYRDYRFKGVKPEMPITGSEYLEKIVHLPFRLPPLTRAQAMGFIKAYEDKLMAQQPEAALGTNALPRLWFTSAAAQKEEEFDNAADAAGFLRNMAAERPIPGFTDGKPPSATHASALVDLLLDSFVAYVPRKLIRVLELMHQIQNVARVRGQHLVVPNKGGNPAGDKALDARVLLLLSVMQLFAPDLYRLIRRRPEIFSVWLRANLHTTSPLSGPIGREFKWKVQTDSVELEVADTEVWAWVAGAMDKHPFTADAQAWTKWLGALGTKDSSTRYTIEQLRLPFSRLLLEYRDIHRHAYAPFKAMAALAAEVCGGDTQNPLPHEAIPSFLQVMQYSAITQAISQAESPTVTQASPVDDGPSSSYVSVRSSRWLAYHGRHLAKPGQAEKPYQARSLDEAFTWPALGLAAWSAENAEAVEIDLAMALSVVQSEDASTRAGLVERLGLRAGQYIAPTNVGALLASLQTTSSAIQADRLVPLLATLAPYIRPQDLPGTPLPQETWLALNLALDTFGNGQAADLDNVQALLQSLAELQLADLARPLGLANVVKQSAQGLRDLLKRPEFGNPASRAAAGDILGRLGDPRFYAPAFYLPVPETLRSQNVITPKSPADWGFVKVDTPFRWFTEGADKNEQLHVVHPKGSQPFWLSPYPVTVAQYACFLKASQTLAAQPDVWEAQCRQPNRPVVGVSWHDATAFVHWLNTQWQQASAGLGRSQNEALQWTVALPTEWEWETAARWFKGALSLDQQKQLSAISDRPVPWTQGGAVARDYPWAQDMGEPSADLANYDFYLVSPSSVGLYPKGRTPSGLLDMAGNVWEWCEDGPEGRRSLRGGSWLDDGSDLHAALPSDCEPEVRDGFIGFRCLLRTQVSSVPGGHGRSADQST